MKKDSRIFIAGEETLIGSGLVRELRRKGFANFVSASERTLDLCDANAVDSFFERIQPEFVFLAAGKSGGIVANMRNPADLIRDNLLTECHIIESAFRHRTRKLLYFASSCCYPKHCPQPMREEAILTGPLEPTNEAYAVAKISGVKLCESYRRQYGVSFLTAIPGNAYGPGDDFHPEDSHVVAALIRKFHEAKERGASSVEVWGSGSPRREFTYVDDVADAAVFVMEKYDALGPVNLGGGEDLSIREIAERIQDVVGFRGELRFDRSKPDGMPVKVLDSSKLKALGWRPRTDLRSGLAATYEWFLKHAYTTTVPR